MTSSEQTRESKIQTSPQYQGKKFVNPNGAPHYSLADFWLMAKKYTVIPRVDPKPIGEIPVVSVDPKDWLNLDPKEVFFSWLGHSSLLISLEGKTILVDPVLEERASPFSWIGPKRFHRAPVSVAGLPPIDVVLITHDHYDHLEEPTLRALAQKVGLFVVPLGIGALLEEWGVSPEKIVELDWWQAHPFGPLTLTATPAIHYSSRSLFDANQRLWCSFSLAGPNRKIFISGDSGYFAGFKEVGERLGPFDYTFLKIGAYDETWKDVHMTAEEAVAQHLDLRGNLMVPLHWASFDMALHPWYEPIEQMRAAADLARVRYLTPQVGQFIGPQPPPQTLWWQPLAPGHSF